MYMYTQNILHVYTKGTKQNMHEYTGDKAYTVCVHKHDKANSVVCVHLNDTVFTMCKQRGIAYIICVNKGGIAYTICVNKGDKHCMTSLTSCTITRNYLIYQYYYQCDIVFFDIIKALQAWGYSLLLEANLQSSALLCSSTMHSSLIMHTSNYN